MTFVRQQLSVLIQALAADGHRRELLNLAGILESAAQSCRERAGLKAPTKVVVRPLKYEQGEE